MSLMTRRTVPGPTMEDGKPRIKFKNDLPETEDGLKKGVMPEIDGEYILMECGTCGYGSATCAWSGYFKIPKTAENTRRSIKPNQVSCPSCFQGDTYAVKDMKEQLRKSSKDELEARANVLINENQELNRQLEEMRGRLGERKAPAKPSPVKSAVKSTVVDEKQ